MPNLFSGVKKNPFFFIYDFKNFLLNKVFKYHNKKKSDEKNLLNINQNLNSILNSINTTEIQNFSIEIEDENIINERKKIYNKEFDLKKHILIIFDLYKEFDSKKIAVNKLCLMVN